MSKIAIVTDSNCGMMPAEGNRLGIHILPMPVLIDGQTYYEGKNLSSSEFYRKLSSGFAVSTSQPSPGNVLAVWNKLIQEYDEIIHIPMSSSLSNTCQTARMLANEKPFCGKVFVVDNHRISVTQAQSVLDAKYLSQAGYSAAEIQKILEREALDASIYIAVNTLEYLKKGGRITPAAAAIGTILNLKPVLTIQGGKLDAYAKTRGMKSAFKTMCKALDKELTTRFSDLFHSGQLKAGLAYTEMDQETLSFFTDSMKTRYPDLKLFCLPLSMSIGCHTGPGALGIGLVRTKSSHI